MIIYMRELASEVQVLAVEKAVQDAGFECYRSGRPERVMVNVIDHEIPKKPRPELFAGLSGVQRVVGVLPVSRPTILPVAPLAPSYV